MRALCQYSKQQRAIIEAHLSLSNYQEISVNEYGHRVIKRRNSEADA